MKGLHQLYPMTALNPSWWAGLRTPNHNFSMLFWQSIDAAGKVRSYKQASFRTAIFRRWPKCSAEDDECSMYCEISDELFSNYNFWSVLKIAAQIEEERTPSDSVTLIQFSGLCSRCTKKNQVCLSQPIRCSMSRGWSKEMFRIPLLDAACCGWRVHLQRFWSMRREDMRTVSTQRDLSCWQWSYLS